MEIELGFGCGTQTIQVPEDRLLGILTPNDTEHPLTDEAEVLRALSHPIGTRLLPEIVKPLERIVILTSDSTRPMPTYMVMPSLLDALYSAGVRPEDITLVFCLGSHRKQTEEEMRKLAGDRAFHEIKCVDGDPTDCVFYGTTSRGTPVEIVRLVAEADRRICLGNIEYHYFAGYSGGAKAVMPGASTRKAIQANHSHMTEEGSCAGQLAGNPVREDIEEAAAMVGVDFIVNVVLDEHKRIIHASAGDVIEAHREGCAFLDRLFAVPIEQRADIVVVSQGGAPKDINLYQTQKALDNAKHAVRDGGIIILVGACQEGLGEKVFEEWMTKADTPKSMITRIRQDFQLGGHKAAAIAMVLERADIYLVSEMDPALVQSIFLKPFDTVQNALSAAEEKLGKDATILLMPYGGSTLPRLVQGV